MTDTGTVALETPRFETSRPLLIAGLRDRFTMETADGIPALWQRFGPRIGAIPGQTGDATYGLSFDMVDGPDAFAYLCGVGVASFSDLPDDLSRVTVPAQDCAIFPYRGHVSMLGQAVQAIFRDRLPRSGYESHHRADAPMVVEVYGEAFDPDTGMGGIEIWIPIKPVTT